MIIEILKIFLYVIVISLTTTMINEMINTIFDSENIFKDLFEMLTIDNSDIFDPKTWNYNILTRVIYVVIIFPLFLVFVIWLVITLFVYATINLFYKLILMIRWILKGE